MDLTEIPRWGERGAAVFPSTLRTALASQQLPRWLLEECKLPEGATVEALDSRVWSAGLTAVSHRIELYACRVLEARRFEVRDLPVLARPWPIELNAESVPWTPRTRSVLDRSGLLREPFRLAQVTYGDLLAIPQMGAKSVLDFAVTAEAAIDRSGRLHISDELIALTRDAMRAPWAELISGEDPRFNDLLGGGKGTLSERLDELQTSPEAIGTAEGGYALASIFPPIFERVAQIEGSPLDVALRDYVAALGDLEGVRLDALLKRFGFDGQPPTTLQAVGDLLNVSRERVRQLQTRVTDQLPSHPTFMPALDRALQAVTDAAPIAADRAARLLQANGITQEPFHPASVLAAARFCGRPDTFEIERTAKGERVVTSPILASAASIALVASRQSDSFGASNLAELASALKNQGNAVSGEQAGEVLRQYSNAIFLNDDWFWMPNRSTSRNRLYNVTRRILSVASPLDVATIRDAARRTYRFRDVAVLPPRNVMTAFFEAHPTFTVDADGRVRAVSPLDYRNELGKVEQILVEVLRSSPTGVLDRASLQEACELRGMNFNTFSVYATYSPVLEHLGTDIWALRGIQVNPTAVDALRKANAARPRERVVEDYGWSDEGRLWLAVRVPRRSGSPVIGVPSPIAHYVADRRFSARAEDGSTAGTIAVNEDGSSWGYGQFLTRRGADEGDVLRIEFHLEVGEVVLKLGGVQLLDESSNSSP